MKAWWNTVNLRASTWRGQIAVAYLNDTDDECLDGIFIDQVVEHLEPAYLVRMLGLCHAKLATGSYLIVETVNPLSLVALFNFYLDLSHKKPLHPETMKYLFESVGMRDVIVNYYSPVPQEAKLKKIIPNGMDKDQMNLAEIHNWNIDNLNNIIYGFRDYAVIGKKYS